ncbi:MAG: metallophosphoesterase family protein [Actinomycetota bacterium]
MKIIHSSDLHLNAKYPERIGALDEILRISGEVKADLLLFAGDFFDSRKDAQHYRPELRKKFSSLPFRVCLIPGNHDYGSYPEDLFFGDSLEVITGRPFDVIDFKGVRVIAVPYYNQSFNELLFDIKKEMGPKKTNILLLHCSLDMGEFEESQEKSEAYLPVSSKVLADLNLDYILAGHFHSRFVLNKISDSSKFIYPGSPVSVTRKETGIRNVALIDTAKDTVRAINLNSVYYETLYLLFEPEKEAETLEVLKEKIKEYDFNFTRLTLIIDGFISSGEKSLKREIDKLLGRYRDSINVDYRYRDVSEVITDPLYKKFREKLENLDLNASNKGEIDRIVKLSFSKIRYSR